MTSGLLLAVCSVHALKPDESIVGVTAIDKRGVAGPVLVHQLGLRTDVQADRKHHGGELKALYAYAEEDAEQWAAELGRDVPAGLFGENLRTRGLPVSQALVGERWRIGSKVIAEVTMPRIPCATFERHMAEPGWAKRFLRKGLPGAYCKVVQAGEIATGDSIEVVFRPGHGVSVADVFGGLDKAQAQALLDSEAAGEISIGGNVNKAVKLALRRG
ncbi:MOSC domain-containing protein [Arthrobacter sp. VKM Ac-2550]|uniref:MOSC domain-containing protein n=1 Tax=Crystallibacter permensis TaxID=1938888 RepID=UPI0022271736|nr:MOSC domain-containing protein [Arthrobacter sp. VKM Ac-2550]MCW2132179.1 MOSC domain-containing protein YiiM [Arthrobacter sp. VKM Ac-2550]